MKHDRFNPQPCIFIREANILDRNSNGRSFEKSGLLLLCLVGILMPTTAILSNAGKLLSFVYVVVTMAIYALIVLYNRWLVAGIAASIPVFALFGISFPVTSIGQSSITIMLADISLVLLSAIALNHNSHKLSKVHTAFASITFLFAFWALFSGVINAVSGYPLNGIAFGIHQFRYFLVVLAIFLTIYRFKFRPFLHILLASVSLQAILGIIQALLGEPFGLPYYGDSLTTSGDVFQTYDILGISVTTGLFPGGFVGFSRSLLVVLLLVFPIAVYQMILRDSYSISSIICVVSAPLFIFLSGFSKSGAGAFVVMVCLLIFVYVYVNYLPYGVSVAQVLVGTVIGVISSVISVAWVLQSNIFSSSQIRIDQYTTSYSIFKLKPVTGIGGRNYSEVVQRELPSQVTGAHGLHSTYLAHLVELGIIGLLLFLIIVAIPYWCCVRGFLSKSDVNSVYLGMIAIGMIGFLVYSYTTYIYFRPRVMLPFWMIISAAVANSTEREIMTIGEDNVS